MPLWRADEAYDWNGDVVSFPMTDGKKRIVCRVSREALEDRASADVEAICWAILWGYF
jgi:Protein of unknown function (DUF1488)